MGLFTSNLSFDLLCLVATLCCAIYLYAQYWFSYWDRRGIKSIKPSFPFGNYGKIFTLKTSLGELGRDLYNATDEPFIGVYGSLRPILLIRDPELTRRILIKDFNHFPNRGIYFDEERDPLSAHLFAIEDQKWKTLRAKLSPTFTSGKLKAMFPTLIECTKILENYLDKKAINKEEFEVREISASHATNVIASVAFGIQVNCIRNPEEGFRYYGRKAFQPTLKNAVRGFLNFVNPKYMKRFGLKIVDDDIEEFMLSIVRENLELREKNNVTRKDFFQLLVQMRNGIDVSKDGQWTSTTRTDGKFELSVEEVAAQAFVFFLAGFETSSTTLSWCLYELGKKPELQDRIHAEIEEVLERHNGEFTYESMNEMKYLEMCIDETLRLYPAVPVLNRVCSHKYELPGTGKIVEKGTPLIISLFGAQRDPKYYPNPDEFNPERFSEENKKNLNGLYYPFGEGPRICIGMRLGKMQTKVGLAIMLHKYKYELGAKMDRDHLKLTPKQFIITPINGIDLKISKRE